MSPGFEGWVDPVLADGMTPRQRVDPASLFREENAEIVRAQRNLTARVHIGGRPVWVKQFRPSDPVDRLMYALRPGKAVYAWNAAMALIEIGLCTPKPLLGLRSAGRLGGASSLIAFEDMGDRPPLRRLLADDLRQPSERDRLMSELGLCLRHFHDRGFRHRDLRQSNILVSRGCGSWSFCFLDLNRLRVQAPLTVIQRLREVEKLGFPADGLVPFFDAYMPDRDSEEMAAVYMERNRYANRLESLPVGRLIRKAWYYCWELRAFARARRP
ncbi:MAG: lipopolysaccharide kinase InaA family protein [Gammaproteobacteria bacterium]|nr:lipopolysaccharide kinase InaA family protein [Gammaproteobacteria bacterium]